MAKYIVEARCFANGQIYDPSENPDKPTYLEVPDDYVPGFFLTPVDAPAKKAFAAYEAKKKGVTTMVNGRPSVDPIERLPVTGR